MKGGALLGGIFPWQIGSFQVLGNAVSAIFTVFFYVSCFNLGGSIEPTQVKFYIDILTASHHCFCKKCMEPEMENL